MMPRPDLPVLDQERWDVPLLEVLEDLRETADDHVSQIEALKSLPASLTLLAATFAERLGALEADVGSIQEVVEHLAVAVTTLQDQIE
jgi:hypothetical protein